MDEGDGVVAVMVEGREFGMQCGQEMDVPGLDAGGF